MEEAIEDTKRDGEVMSRTSHAFAEDPCSSMKVLFFFTLSSCIALNLSF